MTGTAARTNLPLNLRNLFQEPIVDHPVHPVTRELSYIISSFSRFKLCSHQAGEQTEKVKVLPLQNGLDVVAALKPRKRDSVLTYACSCLFYKRRCFCVRFHFLSV